jgi:hypothetical protein
MGKLLCIYDYLSRSSGFCAARDPITNGHSSAQVYTYLCGTLCQTQQKMSNFVKKKFPEVFQIHSSSLARLPDLQVSARRPIEPCGDK